MSREECEKQEDLRWVYDLTLLGKIKLEVQQGTLARPGSISYGIMATDAMHAAADRRRIPIEVFIPMTAFGLYPNAKEATNVNNLEDSWEFHHSIVEKAQELFRIQ